jgi:quercetin dioxygenase-like cupin family protein
MPGKPILSRVNLNAEIERLQPRDDAAGRRAEILVKDDRLRVVLVTMRAGIESSEHSAPGPISIQVLRGRFEVDCERETSTLGVGDLISLAENVDHVVRATEDGAFLLTIGWGQ